MNDRSDQPNDQPIAVKIIGSTVCFDKVDPLSAMNLTYLVASGYLYNFILTEGAILPDIRNVNLKNIYDLYGGKDEPEPFTHVLFTDSDVVHISRDIVEALVSANVPVIGAVLTKRAHPFHPIVDPEAIPRLVQELTKKERTPFQVRNMGLGCCLIRKDVLDRVAEITPTGPVWFTCDRRPRETIVQEFNEVLERWISQSDTKDNSSHDTVEELAKLFFSLGLNAHRNTPIVGEDIAFFDKLAALSIPVYLHPGCLVGHHGKTIYSVLDWMKAEKKGIGEKSYKQTITVKEV